MQRIRDHRPHRKRIGRVSYYFHPGAWWIYFEDGDRPVRRRTGHDEKTAEATAGQVNAQLTTAAPTMFSFTPLTVSELCQRFLEYHEDILRSSVATVRRYRTAIRHLENFATRSGGEVLVHAVDPDRFVRYLRPIDVAPNGHKNASRRKLRDKGVVFILEVCRNLYSFAAKKGIFRRTPYAENPFTALAGRRFQIEDAKRVFVFDAKNELAFLNAAGAWDFPIFFTLAKTGIRPGELIHLLIEDIDLGGGHIRSKPELGWRIKTRRDRSIALADELVAVLRCVVRERQAGPVLSHHGRPIRADSIAKMRLPSLPLCTQNYP